MRPRGSKFHASKRIEVQQIAANPDPGRNQFFSLSIYSLVTTRCCQIDTKLRFQQYLRPLGKYDNSVVVLILAGYESRPRCYKLHQPGRLKHTERSRQVHHINGEGFNLKSNGRLDAREKAAKAPEDWNRVKPDSERSSEIGVKRVPATTGLELRGIHWPSPQNLPAVVHPLPALLLNSSIYFSPETAPATFSA